MFLSQCHQGTKESLVTCISHSTGKEVLCNPSGDLCFAGADHIACMCVCARVLSIMQGQLLTIQSSIQTRLAIIKEIDCYSLCTLPTRHCHQVMKLSYVTLCAEFTHSSRLWCHHVGMIWKYCCRWWHTLCLEMDGSLNIYNDEIKCKKFASYFFPHRFPPFKFY